MTVLSGNAFAAECAGAETSLIECKEGGDGGVNHILILIIDILSIGVGVLAVISLSWAGILYLTSKGDTSKTTIAKRRIGEIVIGIAVYSVIFVLVQWLLPGGFLNVEEKSATNPQMSHEGEVHVGETIIPVVKMNDGAEDKTYTLTSSEPGIALISGNGVRCLAVGEAIITATASNGETAEMPINCLPSDTPGQSSSGGSNSGSKPSSGSSSNRNNSSGNASVSDDDTTGDVSGEEFNGKAHLRKETQKIINEHNEDFYHTGKNSYEKVVLDKDGDYGSYKKYVRSLGGVFERFADEDKIEVKTAADLQAAAEYVFGLYMIWGPDYENGSTHVNWSNSSGFYQGDPNRYSYGYRGGHSTINEVLSKSNSSSIQTHCNNTIHVFNGSTTLKNITTGAGYNGVKRQLENKGFYSSDYITNVKKLKVGDLVNFNACTGHGGHVAMVGEVYKDYIIMYDGGSRFMRNRTYKIKVERKNSSNGRFPGTYSMYCSWYGYRPWNIDQSVTLEGIN